MPFHLRAQLRVMSKITHSPQNLQNCAKLKLKCNEMKMNWQRNGMKMQTRFRASALQSNGMIVSFHPLTQTLTHCVA